MQIVRHGMRFSFYIMLALFVFSIHAFAAASETVDNLICEQERMTALHQTEAMPGEILRLRAVCRLHSRDGEYILQGILSPELSFRSLECILLQEQILNASYYTLLRCDGSDGSAFEIHLSPMALPQNGETEVTVDYSALLETVPGDGVSVNAEMIFRTESGEYARGEPARITFHKVELFRGESSEGHLRALSGAGFSLYRDAEQEDRLRFVKSADGRYILCSAEECTHTHHEYVLKTADTGLIRIDGLISGVYYLQEARPPRGFESSVDNEVMTLTRSGKVYLGGECAEDGILSLVTVTKENEESNEPKTHSLYQVGYPFLMTALLVAVLDYRRLCRAVASLGL